MKKLALLLTAVLLSLNAIALAGSEITVHGMSELLRNLGSDRVIHLAPGTYNLAEAWEAGKAGEPWIKYNALNLHHLRNLTLVGAGAGQTEFLSPFLKDDVLTLEHCQGVKIQGIKIGHVARPGGCQGDAVQIWDSEDITFLRTDIYGCGQYGLVLREVDNLQVKDSTIRNCTYGLLNMSGAHGANFTRTRFTHDGEMSLITLAQGRQELNFQDCRFVVDLQREVFVPGKETARGYASRHSLFGNLELNLASTRHLIFKDCDFSNIEETEFARLKNCGVSFPGSRSQEIGPLY